MCKNKDIAIAKLCEMGFLTGDKNNFSLDVSKNKQTSFENAVFFKQFLRTNFSKDYLDLRQHEIDFYLDLVEKFPPFNNSFYFSLQDIENVTLDLSSERKKEITKKYLTLLNTNFLFVHNLASTINNFVKGYNVVNIEDKKYPFSPDYVTDILKDIGIKNFVDDSGKSFNLDKILNIPNAEITTNNYNFYMPFVNSLLEKFSIKKELLQQLKNPSSTLDYMFANSPNLKYEYSRNTGVYEGYSLREHTQSVMEFFHKNFAGVMPKEFNSLMYLMIFVHDIGKADCFAKNIQKGSNIEFGNYKTKIASLFEKLNISKDFVNFVMDILFKSQIYTTSYYVDENVSGLYSLMGLCQNLKSQYNLDINPDALANLCRILQTCDSASYSEYSQTQDTKTGVYYTSANWRFTNNFEKTKLGYRFKLDALSGSLDNVLDSCISAK